MLAPIAYLDILDILDILDTLPCIHRSYDVCYSD